MPAEIEAKLKVEDFAPVRKRLRAIGAKRRGIHHEINEFFDDSEQSLRRGDQGLRLRIDRIGKETRSIVTFKGPLRRGKFKTREEIEFHVDDPHSARELLGRLGFHPTLSFEKRRESWEFGGCKIELDHVPHLGLFVEIEGGSAGKILALQRKLALDGLKPITTGYIAMLAKYLEDHGIANRRIRL